MTTAVSQALLYSRRHDYVLVSRLSVDEMRGRLASRLHSRYRRSFFPPRDPCHFIGLQTSQGFQVELLVDTPLVRATGAFLESADGTAISLHTAVPLGGRIAFFALLGFPGMFIAALIWMALEGQILIMLVAVIPLIMIASVLRLHRREAPRQARKLVDCLSELFEAEDLGTNAAESRRG